MEPLEEWVRAAFVEALVDVTVSAATDQDGSEDPDTTIRRALLADQRALEHSGADHYDGILDRAIRRRRRGRIEAAQARLNSALPACPGPPACPCRDPSVVGPQGHGWRGSMLSALIDLAQIDIPSWGGVHAQPTPGEQ